MTALSSELADALTAVCDALGDTLRTVRFEHDAIVIELASGRSIECGPTGSYAALRNRTGGYLVFPDVCRPTATNALLKELALWASEQLAQAVEDTDWTRGAPEVTP